MAAVCNAAIRDVHKTENQFGFRL